jgi:hypothetical protein
MVINSRLRHQSGVFLWFYEVSSGPPKNIKPCKSGDLQGFDTR